jgi:hypothetical protein
MEVLWYYWPCQGPSWPWSYGSWTYNYICNQCLSPLMLWDQISIRARCTTLCDKGCQWLATGRWFSPGPAFSSTNNKIDCHDITEILLKVALNTIKQTNIDHASLSQNYLPLTYSRIYPDSAVNLDINTFSLALQ